MYKIKMFWYMSEFEEFVNRSDIEVKQIDIKVVEQNSTFQEGFAGIVYYWDAKPE